MQGAVFKQLFHTSFSLQLSSLPFSSPRNTRLLLLDKGDRSAEAFLEKQIQHLTSARSRVVPGLKVSNSTRCMG